MITTPESCLTTLQRLCTLPRGIVKLHVNSSQLPHQVFGNAAWGIITPNLATKATGTPELPEGNNVTPLRSDTIWLVQNGCSFHRLRSEDPNQHLKDFHKLVDSLKLNGDNKERTRLPLFQFYLHDQASNWLERLPTGDLFASRVPSTFDRRLIKLENQVQCLMEALLAPTQPAQVNKSLLHVRSAVVPTTLSNAWKIPSKLLLIMHPHVLTKREFEADFKQQQSEITNKINTVLKAITDRIAGALPNDTVKNTKLMPGNSEPFDTLSDLGACVNIISLYLFKKLNIKLLKETNHVFGLVDGTKSYLIGIVRDVEVHIGRLKLLTDFYVIDIKKDLETPFLVGRRFLAIANAVIDCRNAKIAVGEWITRSVFGVKGIELGQEEAPYWTTLRKKESYKPRPSSDARDAEINPFKDVLVFRRIVEFLEAIPINLKRNMWESKNLIKNPINWDKPPKNIDGAWHAMIRLIVPDGEEFTKTLQSVPTSRKLFEKEDPREIINLDHFYDMLERVTSILATRLINKEKRFLGGNPMLTFPYLGVKFLIKNKEEIFTVHGVGIGIKLDGVASPAM
ncbi:MAK10-like protein [Tanacetum coccineum]